MRWMDTFYSDEIIHYLQWGGEEGTGWEWQDVPSLGGDDRAVVSLLDPTVRNAIWNPDFVGVRWTTEDTVLQQVDSNDELTLRVKKLFFAAYPKEDTAELLDACKQIYSCLVPADNVWHTTLENGNPEVHPGPCMLNAGRIDYSNGEFWLYREGITSHTVNVLRAIERERMNIGRAFGFELEDAVQSRYRRGYFSNDQQDLQTLFNTSEVFTKIKGPTSVTGRYFTEDISTGLVLWSNLGRIAGVPTPNIDAVITLGCSLLQEDFYTTGLTLDKLNLSNLSVEELIQAV